MKDIILKAFKASSPILFVYGPVGFVFGLLLENEGFYWLIAPIMSLLLIAGSVQFLTLSFIDQGISTMQIIIASFLITLRNVFYGPAFFQRFAKYGRILKSYIIFGLVDGSYAILLQPSPVAKDNDERFVFFVVLFVHAYWIIGTFLGCWLGKAIPTIKGLDFSLTLLFTIMTVEQYCKVKRIMPFAISLVGWILAKLTVSNFAFLGAMIFSIAVFYLMIKQNKFAHE